MRLFVHQYLQNNWSLYDNKIVMYVVCFKNGNIYIYIYIYQE